MSISITLPDGTGISGQLDPATLNNFWTNAVLPTRSWGGDYGEDSYGGDMNACGCFQSVLRINAVEWPASGSSPVLNELRSATILDASTGQLLLSVKFVLDGFQNVPQDANFRTGRIVGTLGPVNANEPLYNPGQRVLQPRSFSPNDPWYCPSFNEAFFKVDKTRSTLVLDLANSICRQSAGGDPVDIGILTASINMPNEPNIPIGAVDYSAFSYQNNALITEIALTAGQIAALDKGTLSLASARTDLGDSQVLTETGSDISFAVEVRPIRMVGDPGTTATTQVYISRKGMPLAGKTLALHIESVHGNTPGATVPPSNPGNTSQADGALQASITPSDANGFATVTLSVVKDPGSRTVELDGQLYFIILYDPEQPAPDWTDQPIQEHLISCLAWSQYNINTHPSWEEVQAMMVPYMKLYPSMRNQLDLTDQHSFSVFAINPPWSHAYNAPPYQQNGINLSAGAIPYFLTRDFNHSLYMPISRDLSPNKLATVLYYVMNLQNSGQAAAAH